MFTLIFYLIIVRVFCIKRSALRGEGNKNLESCVFPDMLAAASLLMTVAIFLTETFQTKKR